MVEYMIRGSDLEVSLLELIAEKEDGYVVKIVHRHDGWEEIKEDFITRDLFETCLRTGYIIARSA